MVDVPTEERGIEDIGLELHAWRNWFAKGRSFPAPREPLDPGFLLFLPNTVSPLQSFSIFSRECSLTWSHKRCAISLSCTAIAIVLQEQ